MAPAILNAGLPAKICYARPPFRSAQPRRCAGRGFTPRLHRATPTDSVDEVSLDRLLPRVEDSHDETSSNSNSNSVLRERVQALEQRLKVDSSEAAVSTSEKLPDQWDLVARVQHQLQRLNPNRLSPRVRGLVLLNILVLLCGANWVVLKETEDFFDPFTFAALRFTLAAAVFSPWVKDAAQDSIILRGGLELGMWSALAYMTQSVGLVTSDASRASFISTFTVSITC